MMKSLRRELDEVKNAVKGKTAMNLDGLLQRTYSPFTASVLECPLPSKFHLPRLEFYDGTKDLLDHIKAFKTILNLQRTPDKVIYVDLSLPPSKGSLRYGSTSYQRL